MNIIERTSDTRVVRQTDSLLRALMSNLRRIENAPEMFKEFFVYAPNQYITFLDKVIPNLMMILSPPARTYLIVERGSKTGVIKSGYGETSKRKAIVLGLQPDYFEMFKTRPASVFDTQLRDSFVHEIQHMLTDIKSKGKVGGAASKYDAGDESGYYNSSDEVNAYTLEWLQRWWRIAHTNERTVHAFLRGYMKNANSFAKFMLKNPPEWYTQLSTANKKRVAKRLVSFHDDVIAPEIERLRDMMSESETPSFTFTNMLEVLLSEARCRPNHRYDPRSGRCIPVRHSSLKGRYKFGAKRGRSSRRGGYSFGQNRGTRKWAKR